MSTYAIERLRIPPSAAALAEIQRHGKRRAVEQAQRSRFWQQRLPKLDLDALDDPNEWQKIPILNKDELRALSNDAFYNDFVIIPRSEIREYWRSGGTSGRPLFYPRTEADMEVMLFGLQRSANMLGLGPGDIAHCSMPLGIHPAGLLLGRAFQREGVGVVWAGSGASAPSPAQIEFLQLFRPSVWIGMPSYAIHLANLARAQGIDLSTTGVRKMVTTAEPLSPAKREKMRTDWGAEAYDMLGMTEIGVIGNEDDAHDGLRVFTDIAFVEVVDPSTGKAVPHGSEGVMVVTALMSNNATPFLRWNTGDIITYRENVPGQGPYAVYPIVKHARRMAGFLKVRGISIGHTDFEDLMYRTPGMADFRVEVVNRGGNDAFVVFLETRAGAAPDQVSRDVVQAIKRTFEISPEITLEPHGITAELFERNMKHPRFADLRG